MEQQKTSDGGKLTQKKAITFGDRLRAAREAAKNTQTELAAMLNVSQQTIASWESNRTEPNIQAIMMLAEYFCISSDTLLYGDIEAIVREVELIEPILEMFSVIRPGISKSQIKHVRPYIDQMLEELDKSIYLD